jgi:hypothetical protein
VGAAAVRRAYQWVQQTRVSRFLRSIGHAEGELTDEQRAKLHVWVETDAGQELLADYAQTVLRTNSQVATVALGLLYGDPDADTYSPRFRRLACEVLDGISDDLVELFLVLAGAAKELLDEAARSGNVGWGGGELGTFSQAIPYRTLSIKLQAVEERSALSTAEIAIGLAHLTTRGLFPPALGALNAVVTAGQMGQLNFAVADDTFVFFQLLTRARSVVAV